VVGLKTSEEAECGGLEFSEGNNCMFTYDQALTPVLKSFSVAASSDGESLEITFIGTGFGTSAYLYLDGIEQQIHSATDSKVVAKVIDFNGLKAEKVEFYAANGAPEGFFTVL